VIVANTNLVSDYAVGHEAARECLLQSVDAEHRRDAWLSSEFPARTGRRSGLCPWPKLRPAL